MPGCKIDFFQIFFIKIHKLFPEKLKKNVEKRNVKECESISGPFLSHLDLHQKLMEFILGQVSSSFQVS